MGLVLKNEEIIFFDTSPFIYFFEKHPVFCPRVLAIFEQLYDCNAQIVTSMISYIELTTHPARLGKHDLVNKYRDYMTNSKNMRLFPLDILIADTAIQLRAKYRFKTPDAIQLATAIHCGADYIITNDREWLKLDNLNILLLTDL